MMVRTNALYLCLRELEKMYKDFKLDAFLADEKGNGYGVVKISDGLHKFIFKDNVISFLWYTINT